MRKHIFLKTHVGVGISPPKVSLFYYTVRYLMNNFTTTADFSSPAKCHRGIFFIMKSIFYLGVLQLFECIHKQIFFENKIPFQPSICPFKAKFKTDL